MFGVQRAPRVPDLAEMWTWSQKADSRRLQSGKPDLLRPPKPNANWCMMFHGGDDDDDDDDDDDYDDDNDI